MIREIEARDPRRTYLDLRDGGAAEPLPVDDGFWEALTTGRIRLDGRLLCAFDMTADLPHWEMHPEGEEVVILLAGAVEFVLEVEDGERRARLTPDRPMLLIPRGVWHRGIVLESGRLLFVTWGEGTRHRPI